MVNDFLRRRCPDCGQLVVIEIGETVKCPSCEAMITGDATDLSETLPVASHETERDFSAEVSDQAMSEPIDEDGLENEKINEDFPWEEQEIESAEEPPPPVDHLDEPSWNMGRPMHQVFLLALLKPDVVPLVTISRSLRWVIAFGVLTSMILFVAEIGVHQQVRPVGAEHEALIKVYDEISNRSPEERRLIRANRWLCDASTLAPEQRIACVLSDLAQGREHPDLARRRQSLEQQLMTRLNAPGFWAYLVWIGGPIMFFFRVVPLWLVLALTSFRDPWVLAVRIIAFVTPALVVATVATWAGVLLLDIQDPKSMTLALFQGIKDIWVWTLIALFLLRMRPSAQGQITKVIILYILLHMLPTCLGMGA